MLRAQTTASLVRISRGCPLKSRAIGSSRSYSLAVNSGLSTNARFATGAALASGVAAGTLWALQTRPSRTISNDEVVAVEEIFEKAAVSLDEMKAAQAREAASLTAYVWGSNRSNTLTPATSTSASEVVRSPKPVPALSGRAFRDLVLQEGYAAAVDENGDVMQWGNGFSGHTSTGALETILKGRVCILRTLLIQPT